MNTTDELERRPAPGSGCARPEHFAAAQRSLAKFTRALAAAGDRPPRGRESWNETRGWHAAGPARSSVNSPAPVKSARQRFRDMLEKHEKIAATIPGTTAYRLAQMAAQARRWREAGNA